MRQYNCYFCAGAECCVYALEPVPVWAVNSPYGEDACFVKRKKKEEEMAKQDHEDLKSKPSAKVGFGDDMISPETPDGPYNDSSPRMQRVREKDIDQAVLTDVNIGNLLDEIKEKEEADYVNPLDVHWEGRVDLNDPAYLEFCKKMNALEDVKKEYRKEFYPTEKDEDGLSQHEAGAKLDHGKVDIYRHFLAMFPHATECVSWVSEYGERKYSYMGWAHVNEGQRRYTAALNRHLLDEAKGEVYDTDPEKGSDLPHAAQAAWNAMARLELMIREQNVLIVRGRDLDSSD